MTERTTPRGGAAPHADTGAPPRDLLLSSGFLAFARHTGVLRAIEGLDLPIEAVCGTSSGALVGALWAAGMDAHAIGAELGRHRPLRFVRPHARPWRGIGHIALLIEHLRTLLPPTFEGLQRPLAVGVTDAQGQHALLTAGPLPEAVAASCAMPWIFAPVQINGRPLCDGGASDRVGLQAWRRWRPDRKAIVHEVTRTAGRDVKADLRGVTLIRTPRSGASFWSLGDFDGQVSEAETLARAALR